MDLPKLDLSKIKLEDFIVDPDAQNVAFLPGPIFTRITELLLKKIFLNLALTCRYMHWRMFNYGHLKLKEHFICFRKKWTDDSEIVERTQWTGMPGRHDLIIPRPYVYFKYLWLVFWNDDFSSMFNEIVEYAEKAKRRTNHYCISFPQGIHNKQTVAHLDKLIQRIKPFHLHIANFETTPSVFKAVWKLSSIKTTYSIRIEDPQYPFNGKTDICLNPCGIYYKVAPQVILNTLEHFIKYPLLQFHRIQFKWVNFQKCVEMIEEKWKVHFKKSDQYYQDFHIRSVELPSEHGNVEVLYSVFPKMVILFDDTIIIRRKETNIGEWDDFGKDVLFNNYVTISEINCDDSNDYDTDDSDDFVGYYDCDNDYYRLF